MGCRQIHMNTSLMRAGTFAAWAAGTSGAFHYADDEAVETPSSAFIQEDPDQGLATASAGGCSTVGGKGSAALALLAAAAARGGNKPKEQYRIIRKLGKGGFGEVYLAEQLSGGLGNLRYAVKFVNRVKIPEDDPNRTALLKNQEVMDMRERDAARLLAHIDDDRIVKPRGMGIVKGPTGEWMTVIATDYVRGVNTGDNRLGIMPPSVVLEVVGDIAELLHKLNRETANAQGHTMAVVHRDIKPGNIMITDTGAIKLIDFGSARADHDGREAITKTAVPLSESYVPPELLSTGDFSAYNHSGDIWALGITLYELLTREKMSDGLQRLGFNVLRIPLREDHHAAVVKKLEQRLLDLTYSRYASEQPDAKWYENLAVLFTAMLKLNPKDRPNGQQVMDFLQSTSSGGKSLLNNAPGPPIKKFAKDQIRPLMDAQEAVALDTDAMTVPLTFTLSEDFLLKAADLESITALVALPPPLVRDRPPAPSSLPKVAVIASLGLLAGVVFVAGIAGITFSLSGDRPVSDQSELAAVSGAETLTSSPEAIPEPTVILAAEEVSVPVPTPVPPAVTAPRRENSAPPAVARVAPVAAGKPEPVVVPAAAPSPARVGRLSLSPASDVANVEIAGARKIGTGSTLDLRITGDNVTVKVTYTDGECRKFVVPATAFSDTTLRIAKDQPTYKADGC